MSERIVISPDYAGIRADVVFSGLFERFSRSQIRKYIKQGNIRIDNEVIKPSRLLSGGEVATFDILVLSFIVSFWIYRQTHGKCLQLNDSLV